jgi:hypothetical protein
VASWAWNTLFIATVSTAISLFCGLLAGYALARLQFRWAPPLGTMIFITYLVPPTLLFIPLGDVVKTFGLGDTPWALILTYPTFLIPFCTWLLIATMNDEGLADARAANPFRLPRLHPGSRFGAGSVRRAAEGGIRPSLPCPGVRTTDRTTARATSVADMNGCLEAESWKHSR